MGLSSQYRKCCIIFELPTGTTSKVPSILTVYDSTSPRPFRGSCGSSCLGRGRSGRASRSRRTPGRGSSCRRGGRGPSGRRPGRLRRARGSRGIRLLRCRAGRGGRGLETIDLAGLLELGHLVRAEVGDADVSDLAFLDHLFEGVRRLLKGRFEVGPVDLVEVDVVDTEVA